jgi:hypothetical protein
MDVHAILSDDWKEAEDTRVMLVCLKAMHELVICKMVR